MTKYIFIYLVFIFSLDFIEGAFRCDYEYSKAGKAWFKYSVIPATWLDARLRCEFEGAILLSPATLEMTNEMINLMKKFNKSEVFTGISVHVSKGDYFTVQGTPLHEFTLLAWAVNEPDNKDDAENCIVLNSYGEILDKSCKLTRPYICYRPDSKMEFNECGTIDPEYRLDKRTQKCYKFHTEPRKFSRAFLACAAEGGHLAIINSDREAKVLLEIYDKSYKTMRNTADNNYAYLGFHCLYDQMDWTTIHGQTLPEAGYSVFEKNQPNSLITGERCGTLRLASSFNDCRCETLHPFFCEKDPNTTKTCK